MKTITILNNRILSEISTLCFKSSDFFLGGGGGNWKIWRVLALENANFK